MKLVQLGTKNDVKNSFHPNYHRLFRLRILGFMKGNPISHDNEATLYSGSKNSILQSLEKLFVLSPELTKRLLSNYMSVFMSVDTTD